MVRNVLRGILDAMLIMNRRLLKIYALFSTCCYARSDEVVSSLRLLGILVCFQPDVVLKIGQRLVLYYLVIAFIIEYGWRVEAILKIDVMIKQNWKARSKILARAFWDGTWTTISTRSIYAKVEYG